MLSQTEVAAIEAAQRAGRSRRATAAALGVDRRTVGKVYRGEHPAQNGRGKPERTPSIRRLLRAAAELVEPLGVGLRTGGQVERYARLHARRVAGREAVFRQKSHGDGQVIETACGRCCRPLEVEFSRDADGAEIVTIVADGHAVVECPNCGRHFPPLRAGAAKDLLSL